MKVLSLFIIRTAEVFHTVYHLAFGNMTCAVTYATHIKHWNEGPDPPLFRSAEVPQTTYHEAGNNMTCI